MRVIDARLLKGAKVLGDFWRSGKRCPEGWEISDIKQVQDASGKEVLRHRDCACTVKTDFCVARVHWINLALDAGRDPVDGENALTIWMTGSEWDATGLVKGIHIAEVGIVKVGTGPGAQIPMKEFVKICSVPETMASMLKLFKVFPGSKIEGIIEGAPAPVMESAFPEMGTQEAEAVEGA